MATVRVQDKSPLAMAGIRCCGSAIASWAGRVTRLHQREGKGHLPLSAKSLRGEGHRDTRGSDQSLDLVPSSRACLFRCQPGHLGKQAGAPSQTGNPLLFLCASNLNSQIQTRPDMAWPVASRLKLPTHSLASPHVDKEPWAALSGQGAHL